jgi:hypothetical protein
MRGSQSLSFLALAALTSCASAPPPKHDPPPSAPSGPSPASDSSGFEGTAGWWTARELGLRLLLPDRAGWRKRESKDWLVLEHPRAHATLRVRFSRAPRLVSPDECQAEARLRDPKLPALDDEEVVARYALVAPDRFHGEVVLGVREAGASVLGYALARGAAVGRCYVAVFESSASGPGRESVVAARLRAVSQSLDSVEVPSVEDRLGR